MCIVIDIIAYYIDWSVFIAACIVLYKLRSVSF